MSHTALNVPEPALRAALRRECEDLIQLRRRIHARPELAFEEIETAAIVVRRCQELGLEVSGEVGGTGVLAELDSGKPGPTALVRADMDALPIQEVDDGRSYRSTVAGVMHACGHDGHVAVALAVAGALAQLTEHWDGRVRLCFQPAEEVDLGAARMIAAGALEGVDYALGLHLIAGLPTGTIAIGGGAQWASSDAWQITVQGRGGHAGDPVLTVDPIGVSAEIILALRSLGDPACSMAGVVRVGQIGGGTASNVTPETVELNGTLRAFNEAQRRRLRRAVERGCTKIAEAAGATVSVRWLTHCPAVICDAEVSALISSTLRASMSAAVVVDAQPSTASDDMAHFLAAVPGCYFRVGATGRHSATAFPHHHPAFDLDESALPVATEALTRAVLAVLAGPSLISHSKGGTHADGSVAV